MHCESEPALGRHFTLHLDKALSSTIEKAAWNPEKDLLAMVTKDQQLIMHRFNWQRLWAVTPEKRITSICWRPDGKVLAAGHNDGTISLHDVENGNALHQTLAHQSSVECLVWVEESQFSQGGLDGLFFYEDRTPRFFPPAPKSPTATPETASAFDISGSVSSTDDQQAALGSKTIWKSSQHRVNILCSGDKSGVICLFVFGVFLIAQMDLSEFPVRSFGLESATGKHYLRLHDPFVLRVSMSADLRWMFVLCHGLLASGSSEPETRTENIKHGLFCIRINSELIGSRSKELCQVALQASSIEELLDSLQASVTVMRKQWLDAMNSFNAKFQILTTLLHDHGSHRSARDEFMSLLCCGLASSGMHQFLAGSLGDGGLKRLSKTMDAALRELHSVICENLQPMAEILTFRIGELRALSKWRARLSNIGLDEKLLDQATEDATMVLVQIERLLRGLTNVAGQFRNFFAWLMKLLRQLNNEQSPQSDHSPSVNSDAVAAFLRTQFEEDSIGPQLAHIEDGTTLELDVEETQRLEELFLMGGFSDIQFLRNTLNKQINLLVESCKAAFSMPVKTVSPQLHCEDILVLCGVKPSVQHLNIPVSLAYYEEREKVILKNVPGGGKCGPTYYMCYQMLSQSSESNNGNIGIVRWLEGNSKKSVEAIVLNIQEGLYCIDLALYKEKQIVLLLGAASMTNNDSPGSAYLLIVDVGCLSFVEFTGVPASAILTLLEFCQSMQAVVKIGLSNGKARQVAYCDVVPPLAVSASRGLACIFAGQRRALLYDLEENEEDVEKYTEMD